MIVTNEGKTITVYNVDFSASNAIYYQLENSDNAALYKITKSEVLIIKLADGTKVDPNEAVTGPVAMPRALSSATESSQYPDIDLSDFHGWLLQAGNCVYIPTDSPIAYEKAGQERFFQRMKMANIWTVVDKPEQAHFVMQFWTSTKGSDTSFVYIRTRKSYMDLPTCSLNHNRVSEPESFILLFEDSNESADGNIEAADNIVNKLLKDKNLLKRFNDTQFLSKLEIKNLTKNGFLIP